MATRTTRSAAPPPPAGLLAAARNCDTTAIRALADWFGERGFPSPNGQSFSDADRSYVLHVYAFEVEVRLVQARQLRFLLDRLGDAPRYAFAGRYSYSALQEFFDSGGLPVEVAAKGRAVAVPTDWEHEEDTRAKMLTLLRYLHPGLVFAVEFRNPPLTVAGWQGKKLIASFSD